MANVKKMAKKSKQILSEIVTRARFQESHYRFVFSFLLRYSFNEI